MQKLSRVYNIILNEGTANGIDYINEIDWEGDFSDVKETCISPEKVVNYLNRVRANSPKKTKDREKFDTNKPFVHSKSKVFKKDDTEIDIEHFIKTITQPPNNVVNTNEKILKSGGPNEYVYKTGLPALRGIVYDIQNQTFHYVNTCPGAGSCAIICYARSGRYIQYPVSYDSMTRRLNMLMNYPNKYEEQMYQELRLKCEEHKAFEGYKSKVILRWNDSGDFFTEKYVKIAENVMDRLQKEGFNIDSYAYTKVADVAKDSDFQSTFSSGANKRETSQIDKVGQKMSEVVPKELFKDLDFMNIDDEQELKRRIAKSFQINPSYLLTYDEMMQTPKTSIPKWFVIVTPNNGDDAAFRKDVKTILLTQH
jgi:hypothetical protein